MKIKLIESICNYFAEKRNINDQTPSLPDPGPATNATLKKQIPIRNRTFSLRDVVSVNPTTNKLTVRKHILDGVKSGVFMKLTETIATGKRGKPAHLFISANQQTVADGLNAAVAGAAVA